MSPTRLAPALGLAPALALLAAAPAQAAGDGLFYPTLNFVLLMSVLVLLTRKPIRAWFDARRDQIRADIESAAELKRQAEERYSTWQRKLSDLDSELAQIRATAEERAATERERLLADARASAERIRQDAATAVDQELRRAKLRLREEAAELAIELAAGVLKQQVTDRDRDQLLDEFIGRIERPGAGS